MTIIATTLQYNPNINKLEMITAQWYNNKSSNYLDDQWQKDDI